MWLGFLFAWELDKPHDPPLHHYAPPSIKKKIEIQLQSLMFLIALKEIDRKGSHRPSGLEDGSLGERRGCEGEFSQNMIGNVQSEVFICLV